MSNLRSQWFLHTYAATATHLHASHALLYILYFKNFFMCLRLLCSKYLGLHSMCTRAVSVRIAAVLISWKRVNTQTDIIVHFICNLHMYTSSSITIFKWQFLIRKNQYYLLTMSKIISGSYQAWTCVNLRTGFVSDCQELCKQHVQVPLCWC